MPASVVCFRRHMPLLTQLLLLLHCVSISLYSSKGYASVGYWSRSSPIPIGLSSYFSRAFETLVRFDSSRTKVYSYMHFQGLISAGLS